MNARDTQLSALFRQLDTGMDYRLTLVLGPTGAGKSALLHGWLAAREWPAAWVELGAADDDPVRFVHHLVTASRHLFATGDALPRKNGADPDVTGQAIADDALAAWLNDLAGLEHDFCLVLDGYQEIAADGVHRAVRLLLDYPPPRMHVYLASRSEPALQLPRLRVRRQLLEVRL